MAHPRPLSPSSVRWNYNMNDHHAMYSYDDEPAVKPVCGGLSDVWNTPSAQEMNRRHQFRKGVREETLQHRRIHRHGGFGGRNIIQVLTDRQEHGRQFVCPQHTLSKQAQHINQAQAQAQAQETNTNTSNSASSPSFTYQPNVPFKGSVTTEIRLFAEYCSIYRYHSAFFTHLGGNDEFVNGQRPASSRAVSTISIAFSPDCQTMASTHGDHTVKITSCGSAHLLQTLEGHPRTPWTVKYHPTDPNIVASGCLGHQVRVWNWTTASCLQMIRLEFAIISLSFHPSGSILAIANGTRLHFWGLKTDRSSAQNNDDANASQQQQRHGMLTEVEQRHMLRCVHFPPNGNTVIVGGVNPNNSAAGRNRGGISGGGMSFYLRLWDFDLQAALKPGETTTMGLRRRAISNPRTFVPRALLYNDGGFDVSPDGTKLCACAEYWLPDGVENVMELLQQAEQELIQEEDTQDQDTHNMDTRTEGFNLSHAAGSATSPPRRSGIPPNHPTPPTLSLLDPLASAAAQATAPPPSNAVLPILRTTTPQTPPPNTSQRLTLSPPSPPGRRFAGGLGQHQQHPKQLGVPPPPTPGKTSLATTKHGRFVPHVVTISLDTYPSPGRDVPTAPSNATQNNIHPTLPSTRPRLGQLLEACPLDGTKASAVTCVKFSPSTNFCLIGYGVREPLVEDHHGNQYHPVTALYRVQGGMAHVSTMLSGDDDVNIAKFHPSSGYGFVYGTKQGRVRVLSPRPWNYYNC